LSTIYAYLFSAFIFISGALLPNVAAEQMFGEEERTEQTIALAPLQEQEETLVDYYDREVAVWSFEEHIVFTESGEKVRRPLPNMPKVRNDHKGTRKLVPSDREKRCPHLEKYFEAYGLYPIDTWSYIAWRESRCRIKAQNATWDRNGKMTYALNKNGSYDTGLLQINSSWRTVTAKVCGEWAVENRMQGLKNIDCNLKVARYIMEHSSGGLSNWSM
jgi:hypothetical protein